MGRCPKPNFLFSIEIIAPLGIIQVGLILRSLIAIIVIATKRKQKSLVEENANPLFPIVYNSIEVSVLSNTRTSPFYELYNNREFTSIFGLLLLDGQTLHLYFC